MPFTSSTPSTATANAFRVRVLARGNDDLSGIRGIASLRQDVIGPAHAVQLGRALIADLEPRLPGD